MPSDDLAEVIEGVLNVDGWDYEVYGPGQLTVLNLPQIRSFKVTWDDQEYIVQVLLGDKVGP